MRILTLYGPLGMKLKQLNEQGQEEEIEISIAEFICHELNVDELVFEHPTFAKMHQIITEALSENSLLKTSYFKRSDDQEIVKFVTEIEMAQHEISRNWEIKHNIYTHTEQDNLHQAVMGSVYGFKISKVERRIREIQQIMTEKGENLSNDDLMDLLSEQVMLEQVKRAISEKLGRIVIR